MIHIQIFDTKSWIITQISTLDLPSGFVHILVISPLPYLRINGSVTTVKPSVNMMCIIFGSVMVAMSPFSMIIPYWQGNLIPSRRPNDYSIILQSFILNEMMCRQYQITMASWDMQRHIRNKSVTNNRYRSPAYRMDLYESILISTTLSWSGQIRAGTYMSWVAQDTLCSIYGKTA